MGNNKESISVAEKVIAFAKEKKDDYGYIKRSSRSNVYGDSLSMFIMCNFRHNNSNGN